MYLHPFFYKYRERVSNTDLSLLQVRLENSQMDLSVLNKPQIPVVNPIIEPAFIDNTRIFSETDQLVSRTEVPEPLDKQNPGMSSNIVARAGLLHEAHCNKTDVSKPLIVHQSTPPPPAALGGDSLIDHSSNCSSYVLSWLIYLSSY